MDLINFIKNNDNWIQILYLQGVNVVFDIFPNPTRALFTYNITKCNFSEQYLRQCRGSVLDLVNMKYVCRPFSKFFNFEETKADKIDWNTAVIREKLDGSLMKVYYDGEWKIATNSTMITDTGFLDLFNYTLSKYNCQLNNFDRNYTYLFELCTPRNVVVVPHTEYKLYFLIKKNNDTGEEVQHTQECDVFDKPKVYSFEIIDDLIQASKELPFNDEGYVVNDSKNRRVKIKSPQYLMAHHNVSDKKSFHNVKNIYEKHTGYEDLSELCSYYPYIAQVINAIRQAQDELFNCIDNEFVSAIKLLREFHGDKKSFNKLIIQQNFIYNNVIFAMLNHNIVDLRYHINHLSWNKFNNYMSKNKKIMLDFQENVCYNKL